MFTKARQVMRLIIETFTSRWADLNDKYLSEFETLTES